MFTKDIEARIYNKFIKIMRFYNIKKLTEIDIFSNPLHIVA